MTGSERAASKALAVAVFTWSWLLKREGFDIGDQSRDLAVVHDIRERRHNRRVTRGDVLLRQEDRVSDIGFVCHCGATAFQLNRMAEDTAQVGCVHSGIGRVTTCAAQGAK